MHGNQRVADADIVTWAAVAVGDQVEPDVASEVELRLNATGRFEAVEVRKRYLSLTASDEIALIIVVTERAGPASANPITRFFGSFGRQALFLPVFDYSEGYGVTYGGHTSFVDVLGEGGRLSVPATWGGTKRVALEADKVFSSGLITRVQGGVTLSRRENPRFEINDDRTEGWVQADRRLPGRLRAEVRAGWADIRFGSLDDTLGRYRIMLELDTRSDQSFPRDAVRARASYEWLDVSARSRVIGRQGYVGRGVRGSRRAVGAGRESRLHGCRCTGPTLRAIDSGWRRIVTRLARRRLRRRPTGERVGRTSFPADITTFRRSDRRRGLLRHGSGIRCGAVHCRHSISARGRRWPVSRRCRPAPAAGHRPQSR